MLSSFSAKLEDIHERPGFVTPLRVGEGLLHARRGHREGSHFVVDLEHVGESALRRDDRRLPEFDATKPCVMRTRSQRLHQMAGSVPHARVETREPSFEAIWGLEAEFEVVQTNKKKLENAFRLPGYICWLIL